MPTGVAATVAFCYREHASFPVLIYIIPVLGVASGMTFGVAKMLWRLRKEMPKDGAKEADL